MLNYRRDHTFMALALVIAGFAIAPSRAFAVSAAVEEACAGDYLAHCDKYDPNSAQGRACMDTNGKKLSQRCVDALVQAGEVSKSEVKRRAEGSQR